MLLRLLLCYLLNLLLHLLQLLLSLLLPPTLAALSPVRLEQSKILQCLVLVVSPPGIDRAFQLLHLLGDLWRVELLLGACIPLPVELFQQSLTSLDVLR